MTRDDIISVAREFCWAQKDIDNLLYIVETAAAAEREAIAQMVEDAPPLAEFVKNDKGGCMVCGFTPKLAAAAIRARGEKE